ncbi:MAG: hypothetical protein KA310_03575 [Pseudomonadales bacterium]|nr:hypothetical protein [Pseudomonadales bacterium]
MTTCNACGAEYPGSTADEDELCAMCREVGPPKPYTTAEAIERIQTCEPEDQWESDRVLSTATALELMQAHGAMAAMQDIFAGTLWDLFLAFDVNRRFPDEDREAFCNYCRLTGTRAALEVHIRSCPRHPLALALRELEAVKASHADLAFAANEQDRALVAVRKELDEARAQLAALLSEADVFVKPATPPTGNSRWYAGEVNGRPDGPVMYFVARSYCQKDVDGAIHVRHDCYGTRDHTKDQARELVLGLNAGTIAFKGHCKE